MNPNEVRELIRKELTEERVRATVRAELLKLIPEIFGRSVEQLKAFFTRTIV